MLQNCNFGSQSFHFTARGLHKVYFQERFDNYDTVFSQGYCTSQLAARIFNELNIGLRASCCKIVCNFGSQSFPFTVKGQQAKNEYFEKLTKCTEGPRIFGLQKNHVTRNSSYWDCRRSPTDAKILHLHVHRQKSPRQRTALVIFT